MRYSDDEEEEEGRMEDVTSSSSEESDSGEDFEEEWKKGKRKSRKRPTSGRSSTKSLAKRPKMAAVASKSDKPKTNSAKSIGKAVKGSKQEKLKGRKGAKREKGKKRKKGGRSEEERGSDSASDIELEEETFQKVNLNLNFRIKSLKKDRSKFKQQCPE